MAFQAHPTLTEHERKRLCRVMDCQKLSFDACMHTAQNERLPLRVVVQVLFFEQLRLRTTVADWFFVSDNADQGSPSATGHRHAPRKSGGELNFATGSEEVDDDEEAEAYAARSSAQASTMSVEEIRQMVVELEEECSSMRQQIHRLGKPKGALSRLFRKLGLGGGRSSSSPPRQQLLQQQRSSGDERRRFLDLGC